MGNMKIAMVSNMPYLGYSGGRYHAYIMVRCLALEGNRVYLITDAIPQFVKDFKDWGYEENIHYVITQDMVLDEDIGSDFDYCIIVPTLKPDQIFCNNCEKIIQTIGGRLVLLNFETPNWYNEFIPEGRRLDSLLEMRKLLWKYGGIVLSSTFESQKFAQDYYGKDSSSIRYQIWNPAINSVAADRLGNIPKENRIVTMIRLKDRHKGADEFFTLLAQPLEGYTVVFIVGTGKVNKEYKQRLKKLSREFHFNYEFRIKLSDMEKFREIKKSKVLVFPTKFEGYGYPPVEAVYCGTKCVAYDLPVLREVNGSRLIYCKYGDIEDMKRKLADVVHGEQEKDVQEIEFMEKQNYKYRAKKISEMLMREKRVSILNSIGGGGRA